MIPNQIETIQVPVSIHYQRIADILDSASRGASYWADCGALGYEKTVSGILNGDTLQVTDTEEDKSYTLSMGAIQKGLRAMAVKSPTHFADFIEENFDDITGDVFLQYCLLGEIVYG